MAREARKQSETGYYHVMMRGNNREKIFRNTTEKQYLIELLQIQADEENISIIAYCLMDNHVHLLIRSDLQLMSEALKWINIKFAGRYNYKYKRTGHVFQGRYKSEVINTEEHLMQVIRYIHNNPVKAKMVSEASDYEWSSYKSYVDKKDKLISSSERQMVIDLFSNSKEHYIKFHSEEETQEFLDIKEDIEREREEKANRIINKYCQQYAIIKTIELKNRKDVLEKIIIELLKNSNLSHRRIAEFLDIDRGTVHNAAKKI